MKLQKNYLTVEWSGLLAHKVVPFLKTIETITK